MDVLQATNAAYTGLQEDQQYIRSSKPAQQFRC